MALKLFVDSDIRKVLRDIDRVDQRCKDLTRNPVKIKLEVEGLGALDGALRSLSSALRAVSGDLSRISSGLNGLNGGAGTINNIAGAARGASGGIGGMTRSMLAFAATVTGVNLVSDAIGFLRESTLDFSSLLQNTMVGFETILRGNKEAAKDLMDELKSFAIPTPFEVPDLAPLAQQVMAFNLVQKDAKDLGAQVTGVLRDLGDAAFGLGRGQPGVDRLVLALGQMQTATRVTGNDMLQLQSVGVNAWQYLAQATGKTTGEVRKLVSKGLVPATEGIAAIRAGIQNDFGGAMEAASKTWTGAVSSIKDVARQKLSNLFAPAFESMNDFAVKAGEVLQSREFDMWVEEFTGKVSAAFAFVVGVYDGFVDEVRHNNPILIALLGMLGARFLWLSGIAIARSLYAATTSIVGFASSFGAPLLLCIAAVAAFGLAYQKNFLGIKDVTDAVVNYVVDGVKTLSWALATAIEWATEHIPGLSALLGDQTGLADGVMQDFEDFDKRAAKWKENLKDTFNIDNIGQQMKSALGSLLPDINKALSEAAAKAPAVLPGKVAIPHIDIAGDGSDEKKRRAAALKVLKDQLGDSAQAWAQYAKAVQKSAEDQIAKVGNLRKELTDFFGMVQEKFLALGVIDDPMGPMIRSFEKLLDLAGRAKAIASGAKGLINLADEQRRGLLSRKEKAEGKDGVLPGGSSSSSAAGTMPTSNALNKKSDALAYARSMLGIGMSDPRIQEAGRGVFKVTGKRDGDEWCVGFIQAIAQNQLGHKIAGGTLKVSDLRAWGEKMGGFAGRAPQSGDLMTIIKGTKGKRDYRSHTAMVDQVFDDGTFSTIGGNEGNQVNSRSRVKGNNRYSWNDRAIRFIPGSVLGGSGATLPSAPSADSKTAASIKAQATQLASLFDSDPNAMGKGKLDEILAGGFDADLGKIEAVNKAWGKAVKDVEGNSVRFALQTKLASKEFNDDIEFMSRITGRSVPEIIAWLRKFANAADFKLNAEGKKEEMKAMAKEAIKTRFAIQDQAAAGAKAGEERAALLDYEAQLIAKGTLDEQERSDALEIEASRRSRINELLGQNATLAEAMNIAQKEAEADADNRRKARANERNSAKDEAMWSVGLDDVPTTGLRETVDNLLPQLREALENSATSGEELGKILSGVPLPLLELERNARAATGALDALPGRYKELIRLLDALRARSSTAEAKDRVNPYVADAKAAAEEASDALVQYGEKGLTPVQILENKAAIALQNIEAMKDAFQDDAAALAEIEKLGATTATYYTTAINAAKQLQDGHSRDKVSEYLGDLTNQGKINGIFNPLEAELERVRQGLKRDKWTDAEIEQILPAERVFLKAEWLKDRVHDAAGGIYDSLLSSIEGVKDKGLASLGDFADGVLNQLNHLAAQIIANKLWSSISGLFVNLLGGAAAGGVATGQTPGILSFADAGSIVSGMASDTVSAALRTTASATRDAMLSRSPSGGALQSGGVTVQTVYHVEKVVANDPKKFTDQLPGSPVSDISEAQAARRVAQVAEKGRKHL